MAYGYTHLGRAVVPDPKLGGADYENVKFETGDGLELEGWYIPSKNGAAVIAFPGRERSSEDRAIPRSPRIRGPPLRPPRRGRQRGRPELPRMGRDQGSRGGCGVPSGAARRGSRPHRRHRALGRGRDAAPVCSGVGRSQGGRVRGRRDPLRPRGLRVVRNGEVGRATDVGGHHRGHRDLLEPEPAAEPEGPCEPASNPRRCSSSTPIGAREAKTSPRTTTRSPGGQSSCGRPTAPRGRLRRRATGVRAEGGPLLQ